MRLDEVAKSLPSEALTLVNLKLATPRTVWVATFSGEIRGLLGARTLAIVRNTPTLEETPEVDYLMTNVEQAQATPSWIAQTDRERGWKFSIEKLRAG